MSFLSQHIAHEKGENDPVTGKAPHLRPAVPGAPGVHTTHSGGVVSHYPAEPYKHSEYPMIVKNPIGEKKQVNSAEEHAALGDGWEPVGHEPHQSIKYRCGCEASGPAPLPNYCPQHGKAEAPAEKEAPTE